MFSFDEEEVKCALPLAPGKSADISVTISGLYHVPSGIDSSENPSYDAPWGLTGVIQFRYSGEAGGEALLRRASISIDVTVVPSLHCENFQIRTHPRCVAGILLEKYKYFCVYCFYVAVDTVIVYVM